MIHHTRYGDCRRQNVYSVLAPSRSSVATSCANEPSPGYAPPRHGEHVGRPHALTASQVREARKMLDHGENASHVARVMRVRMLDALRVIVAR